LERLAARVARVSSFVVARTGLPSCENPLRWSR
jgi:hypothetical protein